MFDMVLNTALEIMRNSLKMIFVEKLSDVVFLNYWTGLLTALNIYREKFWKQTKELVGDSSSKWKIFGIIWKKKKIWQWRKKGKLPEKSVKWRLFLYYSFGDDIATDRNGLLEKGQR